MPIPGDCSFWDYARGDSCFERWLREIDELCQRFLDTDLFSLPEIHEVPYLDLRDCFDGGMRPNEYMLQMFEELRANNGSDLIDSYIAQMAKWGNRIAPEEP